MSKSCPQDVHTSRLIDVQRSEPKWIHTEAYTIQIEAANATTSATPRLTRAGIPPLPRAELEGDVEVAVDGLVLDELNPPAEITAVDVTLAPDALLGTADAETTVVWLDVVVSGAAAELEDV